MTGQLAYEAPCRYCSGPIYMAICRDGRWRSFELAEHPAAVAGVWAWRKRQGMEEQDRVPGHVLHYCAERSRLNAAEALQAVQAAPLAARRP